MDSTGIQANVKTILGKKSSLKKTVLSCTLKSDLRRESPPRKNTSCPKQRLNDREECIRSKEETSGIHSKKLDIDDKCLTESSGGTEFRRRSSGKASAKKALTPTPGKNKSTWQPSSKEGTGHWISSQTEPIPNSRKLKQHTEENERKGLKKETKIQVSVRGNAAELDLKKKNNLADTGDPTFKVPAPKVIGKLTSQDKKPSQLKSKGKISTKSSVNKASKLSVRSTRASNLSTANLRAKKERIGVCMVCNLGHKKNENLIFCKDCSKISK